MRPDTPAENVDHTAEAARLERTADLYPEDTEHLLLQAAAHRELAGDRPTATALYDRLLSSSAPLDNPHLVRALKASNLWEYGHEAEARAIIDGVRAAAPRDPAPWVIVAEALEAHDELEAAQDTFTAAVTLLLTDVAEPPYSTRPLLFGRHRVRRMLGATHDNWDAVADTLHSSSISLDELHDPKRVWSLARTTRRNSRPRSPAYEQNWAPTAKPCPAPSRWRSCTGRPRNWRNWWARTRA